MAGDNRTPDQEIGQIKYADHHGDQKDEKLGQKVSTDKERQSQKEGPAAYAPRQDEPRAFPDRDPAKKKTGEF